MAKALRLRGMYDEVAACVGISYMVVLINLVDFVHGLWGELVGEASTCSTMLSPSKLKEAGERIEQKILFEEEELKEEAAEAEKEVKEDPAA